MFHVEKRSRNTLIIIIIIIIFFNRKLRDNDQSVSHKPTSVTIQHTNTTSVHIMSLHSGSHKAACVTE